MDPAAARYRAYCYTLNNYTREEEAFIKSFKCNYHVFGKETGNNNTPHLQGYVEFTNGRTLSTMRKKFNPRAHFEHRKATSLQASDYCKKGEQPHEEWTRLGTKGPNYGLNASVFEEGQLSAPGNRSDLSELYNDLKSGKSDAELQELHTSTYAKYYKAVDRMRLNLSTSDSAFQHVKVTVLYGDAGTGKTRRAFEIDPALYFVPPATRTSTMWFDGYTGQKTILFDDFYGDMDYSLLLRLLDGYRFHLPVKGAFTWKAWEHVIMTSNSHPSAWYPTKGFTPALKRRITDIEELLATPPPYPAQPSD